MIKFENDRLVYISDGETLRVEPWGENAFRVRAVNMTVRQADRSGLPHKEHAGLPSGSLIYAERPRS